MGLDMYLSKKHYIKNWKHTSDKFQVTVKLNKKKFSSINTSKITSIEEEVAYWRKANHIHNWFVNECQDGIDDCREHYVEREKLKKLLAICKQIKNSAILIPGEIQNGSLYKDGIMIPNIVDGKVIKDPSLAEELLPTTSGFFFGGTNYNEYYLQTIDETIEILEEELTNTSSEYITDYYYSSSW
jgi:hypothetical protein